MDKKREDLKNEIAKLMKFKLFEIDQTGHVSKVLLRGEIDEGDQEMITVAHRDVSEKQVILLNVAANQRKGFCFMEESGQILCGISHGGIEEWQIHLAALCLYIGILGQVPVVSSVTIKTTVQDQNNAEVITAAEAVATENWPLMAEIFQRKLMKTTNTQEYLVSLSLTVGLFFGKQLRINQGLKHVANQVHRWWIRLRTGNDARKLTRQLVTEMNVAADTSLQHVGDRLVNEVFTDIKEHLTERLLISEIAQHLGVSADYLNRHFHQQTGWRLKQYVTKCKIERAKQLLMTESVAEVCYDLSFSDQSHFAKVFRQQIGMNPLEFKREERQLQIKEQ
ncbi:helix-turn-helix domain-containing protein [Furfurilactobacillus sp. WILCCON 0119]